MSADAPTICLLSTMSLSAASMVGGSMISGSAGWTAGAGAGAAVRPGDAAMAAAAIRQEITNRPILDIRFTSISWLLHLRAADASRRQCHIIDPEILVVQRIVVALEAH